MLCPKCSGAIETVRYEDVEVDRCTQCSGLWFDELELNKVRGPRAATAVDTGDPKAGRRMNQKGSFNCPRCQGPTMLRMVDLDQPHIWYEECTVCHGVWLDAGELRDLSRKDLFDQVRDMLSGERT